ncbi:DUF2628 domain-containing protein [Parvibaculum sp.]|uniref:DUF2628 domain-containing protein n=1 Tax=Parvibaculum sp. TaxID=2024848 RepID=UPI002730CFFD|nr:DUF2628 domain-containing protein [Parvibaculum sp.]MDP1625994.1 DUF2628 domain-containing protein [Parvibaculum sp.]MDP2149699.1 DUF2628 domain-containing protein [Parvibaculum sp.]MDP3328890.1 DUF2628 domain-containing protein [Parvibaculum sp.]
MRIYTVHELQGAPLDGAGIVLVKEGFSFPAFVFSWAWLLWHRLWIALGLWIGLIAVISFFVERLAGAEAAALCSLALQLLLGFEANDIRRWTMERKGYRLAGIVGGSSLEEAERNFFANWGRPLDIAPEPPAAKAVWPRRAPAAEKPSGDGDRVFGLFPKAGG